MSDWPFDGPPDVATITTIKVLYENHPILLVTHEEEDGTWQFLCGATDDPQDGRVVGLGTILKLDPGVAMLANLPYGWQAWRESPESPWQRDAIPPDDAE
jgi:hypothetical protein